jgi:rubredoxin
MVGPHDTGLILASDRLIATKEEVAMLRSKFEAELARQAAKAAKLAAASKLMTSMPPKGSRTKRSERAQRARTVGLLGGKNDDQSAEFLDQTLSGMKTKGNKKKRSALANASNPHHLRNYVPSRLPHSGQTNVAQAQNYLGLFPLRFLSAEAPPRQRTKIQTGTPASQFTNPNEEWICPLCEYQLFYGDEQDYRRSVRLRKKILRRRRRARERAAAAASGNSTAKVPEKSSSHDGDAPFDAPIGEFGTSFKQPLPKWKGDPSRVAEKEDLQSQGSFG